MQRQSECAAVVASDVVLDGTDCVAGKYVVLVRTDDSASESIDSSAKAARPSARQ